MARIPEIEKRLQEWAQWLKVGDGSGYPTKSTLHSDWSPPSPGMTPSMKVGHPSKARQTGRAVEALSQRLQDTLVVHYVMNLSLVNQSLKLACEPKTVEARIRTAHRQLMLALREN